MKHVFPILITWAFCTPLSAQKYVNQNASRHDGIRGSLESVSLEDLSEARSDRFVVPANALLETTPNGESQLHWQPVMEIDDGETGDLPGEESKREMTKSEKRREVLNDQLARLRRPIGNIDLRVDSGIKPPDSRAAIVMGSQPERWVTATGISPALPSRCVGRYSHRPLYFEEIDVERCGNGWGMLTNPMSLGIFFSNTVALPYRIATQRPDRCMASGPDCKACEMLGSDFEPLEKHGGDLRGLTATAATLAGFSFLFL